MGVAGAAAAGLVVGDVSAAPTEATPRLPVSILLRAKPSDDRIQAIRALSPQITIGPDVAIGDANVIFGNISVDDLNAAKNLRWVQCQSAGVEHYPLEAM